jgi:hypothetical protein
MIRAIWLAAGVVIMALPALANSPVAPGLPPGSEQNNVAVAWSETKPGEVYAVYNHHLPGMLPAVTINWSWSPGFGAAGTWSPMGATPPPPYTGYWNPSLASAPAGGFMLGGTAFGPGPQFLPTGSAVYMTGSLGGGAPFGALNAISASMV